MIHPKDPSAISSIVTADGDDGGCIWTSWGGYSINSIHAYRLSGSGHLEQIAGLDWEPEYSLDFPTDGIGVIYLENHSFQATSGTDGKICKAYCRGAITTSDEVDGTRVSRATLIPMSQNTAQAIVDRSTSAVTANRIPILLDGGVEYEPSLDSSTVIGVPASNGRDYVVHSSTIGILGLSTLFNRNEPSIESIESIDNRNGLVQGRRLSSAATHIQRVKMCSETPTRVAVMGTSRALCDAKHSHETSSGENMLTLVMATKVTFLAVWTMSSIDQGANDCCVQCGNNVELGNCESLVRYANGNYAPPPFAPPPPSMPEYETPPLDKRTLEEEIGRMMDQSCCVRPSHLRNAVDVKGHEHCHRSHCTNHAVTRGVATVGRRLQHRLRHAPKFDAGSTSVRGRRMQESTIQERLEVHNSHPQTALSPAMQVAIDMLNDHNYPIEGCDYFYTAQSRVKVPRTAKRTNAECMLHNVVKRVSEAHGYDANRIMSTMNTIGGDATNMIAKLGMFVAATPEQSGREARSRSNARNVRRHAQEDLMRERHEERKDLERIGRLLEEESRLLHESFATNTQTANHDPDELEWHQYEDQRNHDARHGRRLQDHADDSRDLISDNLNVDDPDKVVLEESVHRLDTMSTYQEKVFEYSSHIQRLKRRRGTERLRSGQYDDAVVSRKMQSELSSSGGTVADGMYRRGISSMTAMASYSVSADGSIAKAVEQMVPHVTHALNRKEISMVNDLKQKLNAVSLKETHISTSNNRKVRKLSTSVEEQRVYQQWMNFSDTIHRQNMFHFRRALTAHHRKLQDAELQQITSKLKTRRTHERLHDMILYDIPWHKLIPNMRSLMEADMHKMNWWADGAIGEPPLETESTIHSLIGTNIPPSEVGRAMRRLGYEIMYDKSPPWEVSGKLQASMQSHRSAIHESARKEDDVIWWPSHAFLDGRNRTGAIRRLTEDVAQSFGKSLFGNNLNAPLIRILPPAQTWSQFFDNIITYVVYNVFLCYLHKPNIDGSSMGRLKDGTEIEGHRSTHMCFPAIPFALPQLSSYNETFRIDPHSYLVKNNDIRDYANFCPDGTFVLWVQNTAESFTRTVGYDVTTPQGRAIASAFVYPVWAFSSLDSIVRSFAASTAEERLRHAVCGLAHVGSVAYFIAFLFLLSGFYLCMCWPCVNILSMCLNFICCGTLQCCRGRRRRRKPPKYLRVQDEIDEQ